MIQVGNPQLQPQFSHNIQALVGYKGFSAQLGYSYIKDYMNSIFQSDGNVVINSWKNYDKAELFRANMSYTRRIGCWNTILAGGFSVPSFKIDYLGEKYNNDKMQFYAQSNNQFELPKAFILSLDYMYNNGGSMGIYKYKPYHSLSMGMQKSFMKDKLNLSFNANDIFRTMVYKYDARIGNIYFKQKEDQDERYVSFNIVYRFNNVKSKYSGTGAANEEIQRLR